MDHDTALGIVLSCLRDAIEQLGTTHEPRGTPSSSARTPCSTPSGVVSLIVDVEQRLEMDHGVSVTLASDKAMSQTQQPLSDRRACSPTTCCAIVSEEAQAA